MLPQIHTPEIHSEFCDLPVSSGAAIHVEILRGPRRSGRTAIYIHGGGGGGNHTMITRPSRYLIRDGFFDTIILPDKRGDGLSAPLTGKHTILDHAADMQAVLDGLDIRSSLTAMGVSYGGPVALALAQRNPRVERVILVASSPELSENNGVARWLLKTGLLRTMMRAAYRRYLGKLPPAQVDFDPANDQRGSSGLVGLYVEALKRTPRDRMDSLLYALEATLDQAVSSLPDSIRLDVPVIQIIGARDEVWGSQIKPEYLARFPRFHSYRVPGGKIHKDVLLKPGLFYDVLKQALSETAA